MHGKVHPPFGPQKPQDATAFGNSFTSVTVMDLEKSTLHHESISGRPYVGSMRASAVRKAVQVVSPSFPRAAQVAVVNPWHPSSEFTAFISVGHASFKFTPHDLARLEMIGM